MAKINLYLLLQVFQEDSVEDEAIETVTFDDYVSTYKSYVAKCIQFYYKVC